MIRLRRPHLATLIEDFERNGSDEAIIAARGLRTEVTSYGDLAALSRRFGAELAQREIRKGDRVLLWGANSADWVAAFFGCVLRGVLPVPIDAASPVSFVQRIIGETQPKLVVADQQALTRLSAAAPALALGSFADTLTTQRAVVIDNLNENDPLQIIFTSGTTSDPKGVVHTHRNVLASLQPIESEIAKYLKYERFFHPIRFLHTLPLSHVFGQFMGLWIPPLLAAEVHFESRLVPSELVEHIQRDRISVLACVPRILELLQAYLTQKSPGLSMRVDAAVDSKVWQRWWQFRDVHRQFGWKFWAAVCGGASLSPQLEQFWGRLGFLVVQGYGMTETTALISLNHPFRAAIGTIGQVLPGREVRLSDDGEVLVRGETISNATWQSGAIRTGDSEWLATGDLGEFDAAGNLRFRGRKKDVIVTSAGLNIYPDDLEAALTEQPAVRWASVVEAETDHGPEPHAVLIQRPGTPAESIEAAVAGANRKLADFQQIRRWTLWPDPDFPRTSTGKVLKREIVSRLASERLQTAADSISPEALLDSLGRVELQARLEQQYGITLDDAALQSVRTPDDVRQLMTAGASSPARREQQASLHIYPRWPWSRVLQAVRSVFLEAVAMPLVRFLTEARTHNHVTEWPNTPMLIVANHVTSYDVPFILYALPGRIRRRVAVAMSGEMILDFRRGRNQGNWFLNALAPIAYLLFTGLFNVFPLPQQSGYRRSFRHAGEAIDHGYSVLVFPEGRRSDDGTPQPFRSGAGLLWKELRTPALPVHLSGLGEIKASRSRWFRTGAIRVDVLPLLPPQPQQGAEELALILQQAVFEPIAEETRY